MKNFTLSRLFFTIIWPLNVIKTLFTYFNHQIKSITSLNCNMTLIQFVIFEMWYCTVIVACCLLGLIGPMIIECMYFLYKACQNKLDQPSLVIWVLYIWLLMCKIYLDTLHLNEILKIIQLLLTSILRTTRQSEGELRVSSDLQKRKFTLGHYYSFIILFLFLNKLASYKNCVHKKETRK